VENFIKNWQLQSHYHIGSSKTVGQLSFSTCSECCECQELFHSKIHCQRG